MKPMMHDREIEMIESYLTEYDTMLEWGCGGSTNHYAQYVKEYYSIEHDKSWYDKINSNKLDNVTMYYVPNDLPRTMPTKEEEFLTYINYIDKIDKKFDKILVDGRARNYCALKAFDYLDNDGILFIHDFWNRKYYHNVLDKYIVHDYIKDTEQTLVVLKKGSY